MPLMSYFKVRFCTQLFINQFILSFKSDVELGTCISSLYRTVLHMAECLVSLALARDCDNPDEYHRSPDAP